ncbi:GNAT family N-acetyltransferase [uncultured Sphaerochaeta sp.]|uniref:GNAT family N-acetyltransferase n=1 Tax=uncultured Sphaerochaeta sp. TaxID=886478 RepID=UPI002A0A370E|nr:GNAT family N-acetyltransferase [uncultured Sphaerochaeta sp.]
MEHIRKACHQDLPHIYRISLKTSLAGLDGTDFFNDPFCVGHYYAAPYLFHEPDLCYVALNGHNVPSGYIVGTSNTEEFNQWMNQVWLPTLQEQYKCLTDFKCQSEERIVEQICKGPGEGIWEHVGYSAHLHINLLPEMQGQGIGKGLMTTLFEALQEKKIDGVHLGVDGHNDKAKRFYERIGMTVLETPQWGSVYGKSFF